MQNSKSKKIVGLLLPCILMAGCFSKNESFEEAISIHRGSSLTTVPKLEKGLPFFIPGTLTPTWQTKNSKNIVHIPDFDLKNHRGQPINENLFRNKVSIVAFFFTSCAGFCPILVKKLQGTEQSLHKNEDVQFVLFSVDPEVDSPERLTKFATKHRVPVDNNWILVTGKKDEIYSLAKSTFASEVRRLEATNMRKFAHTEHFYVIDQKGRLRGVLNGTRIDLPQQAKEIISQLELMPST